MCLFEAGYYEPVNRFHLFMQKVCGIMAKEVIFVGILLITLKTGGY